MGAARANQLVRRDNLSEETVKRMNSYFARHEVDKNAEGFRPGEKGFPSAGRIAWALWGGDPGKVWAKAITERLKKEMAEPDSSKVSKAVESGLKSKLEEHLEKVGEDKRKRTTLGKLKIVYNRGIGAYKTNPGSVRPFRQESAAMGQRPG